MNLIFNRNIIIEFSSYISYDKLKLNIFKRINFVNRQNRKDQESKINWKRIILVIVTIVVYLCFQHIGDIKQNSIYYALSIVVLLIYFVIDYFTERKNAQEKNEKVSLVSTGLTVVLFIVSVYKIIKHIINAKL